MRDRQLRPRGPVELSRSAPSALESITPASPAAVASERTGSSVRVRLGGISLVAIGLFTVLLVRLWGLQVVQGPALNRVAAAETSQVISTPAPRGELLASGGQVLAGDIPEQVASITTTIDSSGQRVASSLAERDLAALIPGLTSSQIVAEVNSPSVSPHEAVPVAFNLSQDEILAINGNAAQYPGVTVTQEWVRRYPYGELATPTIGYVGQIDPAELKSLGGSYTENDVVGQYGLEKQYEKVLQGTPGTKTLVVDRVGDVVGNLRSTPAKPGGNVVLHLDLGLQQAVNTALAKELGALHAAGSPAPWAAATAEDPRNGALLAISSLPTYNDNWWIPAMSESRYASLQNGPLINYAASSEQPPGSTFKLATATAALNDGLINADTTIDDPGSFTIGNVTLHDSESAGLGNVNIVSALAESSDVFFYTLGEWFSNDTKRYGQTPIQDVANDYGLGVPSGVDLPTDEVSVGYVDSLKVRQSLFKEDPLAFGPPTWYPADNVEMAFGQGETVVDTLELATAYSTFANGGTRYAPELASEIENSGGKVVTRIKPRIMGHVPLPASTKALLQAGFNGAVRGPGGTATSDFVGFDFNTWNLAGKTGTATVSNNQNTPETSWFVGFGGPKPGPDRYVVSVEISKGGYGAAAAGVVARAIFNYLYTHPITN